MHSNHAKSDSAEGVYLQKSVEAAYVATILKQTEI
jgi:hypothetical protein